MKKTITKPDGTHEVVEGTAEEIAEYERKVRQEAIREEPKKPGLLTDDLKRLDGPPAQPVSIPTIWYEPKHSFECPISVAQRGAWLCVNPPECNCGAVSMRYKTYTETWISCQNCHRMRKFGEPCSCETFGIPWYTITCNTNTQYYNGNQKGWKL